MKENDFTPSNDDQEVLEEVAEFTAGSPVIVDITSQVVQSCFSDEQEELLQNHSLSKTHLQYQKRFMPHCRQDQHHKL